MMGWGYGIGAGMWSSWLVIVLVVALLVFLVVRAGGPDDSPQEPPRARLVGRPTPCEILADRYARGEIDTEEYEE